MQFPRHDQQGMDDDPLRREAAEWFVRLNTQEPNTDEVGDWQRWLLKSEAHRQAFAEFEDLWQTIGQTAPHLQSPADQPAVEQAPSKRWRWPVALAATVLFGAVGAVLFNANMGASRDLPSSALVQTQKAEDRSYALPDGSRIDVGASTRVVVDFGPTARNVFIDSGEAYFQVAHDTARPFVVHAGTGTITAVGTAFNVHTALGRVSVAVVEGTVKVNSVYDTPAPAKGASVTPQANPPLLVHAGEGVAYDRSVQPVESIDARVATSWRSGHLKFLREPLAYVVSDIERYADLQISIADPSLGELLYTGTVVPENLDDWLALVSHAFPIEVQRINKRAILLKRRDAPTARPTDAG